jgi:hypothetical protein
MSKHRVMSFNVVPRLASGRRFLPALAVLAALPAGGCVSRTLDNHGLEAVSAPGDTAVVGNMVLSPGALALGQRIIRFDNTGRASERAARRKDADLRMSVACAGDYRTGAEGPAASEGVVGARIDGASRAQSPYWYIQYVCVGDEPATQPPR